MDSRNGRLTHVRSVLVNLETPLTGLRFLEGSQYNCLMEFEWDATKAPSNEQKHGVDFLEAMTIFADPRSLTAYDLDHSDEEDRHFTRGY
jgi:hypothetical protein